MGIGQKYILPIALGFIGMFACHLGLFFFYQAGIKFMAYVIVYPIVYALLTAILTIIKSRYWLTNAIFLCLIPIIYWYLLLLTDGRINFDDFSIYKSSGMWVIVLLTLGLSILIGFVISKLSTAISNRLKSST